MFNQEMVQRDLGSVEDGFASLAGGGREFSLLVAGQEEAWAALARARGRGHGGAGRLVAGRRGARHGVGRRPRLACKSQKSGAGKLPRVVRIRKERSTERKKR